jgi:hypothetical protein
MDTIDMIIWLRDNGVRNLDEITWHVAGYRGKTWAHADPQCDPRLLTAPVTLTLEELADRKDNVCTRCLSALHPDGDSRFLLQMSRLRILLEDLDERLSHPAPHHGNYPHLRAAALQHSWERHQRQDNIDGERWRCDDPYLAPAVVAVEAAWIRATADRSQDREALEREIVAYCANELVDRYTPWTEIDTCQEAREEDLADHLAETSPTICHLISFSLLRDSAAGDYRTAIIRNGLLTTPSVKTSGRAGFGRYPEIVSHWLSQRFDPGETILVRVGVDDARLADHQWDTVVGLMADAWDDDTSPYNDMAVAIAAAAKL